MLIDCQVHFSKHIGREIDSDARYFQKRESEIYLPLGR